MKLPCRYFDNLSQFIFNQSDTMDHKTSKQCPASPCPSTLPAPLVSQQITDPHQSFVSLRSVSENINIISLSMSIHSNVFELLSFVLKSVPSENIFLLINGQTSGVSNSMCSTNDPLTLRITNVLLSYKENVLPSFLGRLQPNSKLVSVPIWVFFRIIELKAGLAEVI